MAFKHLDDPLEYLYEELPDAEMAEVRKHLAECPQCREEVARVRATVKFYRRDSRPLPPAGLAGRTAAAALRAVAEEALAEPSGEVAGSGKPDAQFDGLRSEVREELRSGKRKWLFHPAWAVAASVILVFTVLYHVSPRRATSTVEEARMAVASAPPTAREPAGQERRWSPLPESAPKEDESLPVASSPAPAFGEAKVWEQPPPAVMREIAPDVVPAAPAQISAESAGMAQSTLSPFAGKAAMKHLPEGASLRPPAPAPPFAPAPVAPVAPAPMAGPLAPSLGAAVPDEEGMRAQAFAVGLPGENLSASELEELSALLDAAPAGAPVIIDLAQPVMEPPQLLPRIREVDTEKLARDLIFMAGMQMGHGELEEAGITIGLLRKYDPEKALELDRILDVLLEEKEERELAAAREEAEREAAAASVTPEPVPAPTVEETRPVEPIPDVPDKYFYVPGKDGETATDPVHPDASEEPAAAAPIAEIAPWAAEPIAESPVELLDIDAEMESPFIGPVYSDSGASEPAAAIEPASADANGSVIVEAPDVPKVSPDAPPPTLWESSTGATPSGRSFSAPAREPRRRAFTTDPYFRDW